jgi:ribonuclease P protein component
VGNYFSRFFWNIVEYIPIALVIHPNTKQCLSHINQKKEKELNHMVFLYVVKHSQEETHYYDDDERVEPNWALSNMLPKNRRIKRSEFPFILQTGKRFNSPHFLLYVANTNEKHTQVCFSVSKKILKHAVQRNKCRRQGYAVVSRYINKLKSGRLLFFVFKKGSYPIPFTTLASEIDYLLTTATVIL